MAAQEQAHEHQEQKPHRDEDYVHLLSKYVGLSFTIFLGLLPNNSIPLLSALQKQNKSLSFQLTQAEEELSELLCRRKEDSKANARVVEIFASQRHSWHQEERRLLQQINDCNDEIAYLKGKVEDFEGAEAELKVSIQDLKREISERDEMLDFMSRSNCEVEDGGGGCYSEMGLKYGKAGVSDGVALAVEDCYGDMGVRYGKGGVSEVALGVECFAEGMGSVYGQSNSGFSPDFLNSSASKFWSEKASLWQDMQQYEPLEPVYHMKPFVSRRESPWKIDGDSSGVSSKLILLEQELLNLERVSKADQWNVPSQMRKQAKRYQALAGKINELCRRMQASDPCEASLSSEFRTQKQTEFLLEAFRLKQSASEINQKLMAWQTETGKSHHGGELDGPAKIATRRSLDSIRNNLKDIQRNLEIWLARIIGDLEGLLAADGASRAREYYVSRYHFVQ